MSTDELRRELDRIADRAPAADVPDDTWTRARRSAVRDRVAVGGAALAVVAAVAAGVTWLPDRAEPPVAETDSGAIPSRIWTLPDDTDIEAADNLAVGPVGAVYVSLDGPQGAQLVAVSATDGTYRTLSLPDPSSDRDAVWFGWDDQVFQLAPDGRQLAYNFFPANGKPGVGVVDLMTGAVRIIRLDIGIRGFVRRLIWSPGGRYLIWWGQPHSSKGFGNTMAGLIEPGATRSKELPEERRQDEVRNYAVDDAGQVFLIDNYRVRTWRDGEIVESRLSDLGSTYSGSAQPVGGELVEARVPFATDAAPMGDPALLVRSDVRSVTSGPFPSSLYGWDVLGWTAAGAAIVEADTDVKGSSNKNLYRVELDGDGTVTSTQIVTLESALDPDKLTVASDLPVEDLPAPEWADEPWWGIDPSLLIGLGVAAAIAVLMGLRWGWRRYLAAR